MKKLLDSSDLMSFGLTHTKHSVDKMTKSDKFVDKQGLNSGKKDVI